MADPLRTLRDRQAVVDTLLKLGRGLDEQDWPAVRACLADEVDTDYSSFRGTPPARLPAEEFIRLRQEGLAGLKTQHLGLNHLVEFAGDRATCRCDFVVHRWPADPEDRRFFHTYGTYLYKLIRAGQGWRVASIVQTALRSEGDSDLHGALRASGEPAPRTVKLVRKGSLRVAVPVEPSEPLTEETVEHVRDELREHSD